MNDIIRQDQEAVMPALSVQQAVERFNTVVEFVQTILREGADYGTIPGTSKPTLLKPGAEKLTTFFGLTSRLQIIERIEDWTGEHHEGEPFFYYFYRCQLFRGDTVVAEGDGSCNSRESKYRYRNADRVCPICGQMTIIKGKAEYGGGFICFTKKGGCGAKFRDDDPQILNQPVGRVLNPDIADQVNTIQKMAAKRAIVAATLLAVNASEFFTQDMDDMYVDVAFTVEALPDRQALIAELRSLRDQLRALDEPLHGLTQRQVEAMSLADLEREVASTRLQLQSALAAQPRMNKAA